MEDFNSDNPLSTSLAQNEDLTPCALSVEQHNWACENMFWWQYVKMYSYREKERVLYFDIFI